MKKGAHTQYLIDGDLGRIKQLYQRYDCGLTAWGVCISGQGWQLYNWKIYYVFQIQLRQT